MYPLFETRARCAQLLAEAAALAAAQAAAAGGRAALPDDVDPARLGKRASRSSCCATYVRACSDCSCAILRVSPRVSFACARTRGHTKHAHVPRPPAGEEYLEALSGCLRLQGVANAGSDMHVQLAARWAEAGGWELRGSWVAAIRAVRL